MTRIDRKEVHGRLLAVMPGVSNSESLQQSSCVILRRGRFYTMNREIACSLVSTLPQEIEGAVKAKVFSELLDSLPDGEIQLSQEDSCVKIKGTNRTARLVLEKDVFLPVDDVERPEKDSWVRLDPSLLEGIDLVRRCTKRKEGFVKECMHITSSYMESSDNSRLIRYTIPTFVKDDILVRGESLKEIPQLGMTRGSETKNWLHFNNPLGLRVSVRKFPMEAYPALDQFLSLRGRKIIFPQGLRKAAEIASLFEEEEGVQVKVSKGKIVIYARGVDGDYREVKKMDYNGPMLNFAVPGKILNELATQHGECEVCEFCLRVGGEKYIFCTSLEKINATSGESGL